MSFRGYTEPHHAHHGMSSSSSFHHHLPSAFTPLASPSTNDKGSSTPVSTSSISSSSSIISRQSSIRSTSSVVAVPMKKPFRGPASATAVASNGGMGSSPAMTRGHSGSGLGHEFDSSSVTETVTTPPRDQRGYFNQYSTPNGANGLSSTPMALNRSAGGSSSGGSDAITPGLQGLTINGGSARNGTVMSAGTGNSAFEPGSVQSGMSDWTAVGVAATMPQLMNDPSTAVRNGSLAPSGNPANLRPELDRSPSSNLSDQAATRPVVHSRDASTTSVVVVRKTPSDFTVGEILGEGSYSTVTLVTDKLPPHQQYALKVLDKEHIKREKKTKYVLIERDTLKALDGHPGIVRLYWTFQDQHSLYYVLELAKNGELLKWIKKVGSFAIPSARFYAAQILSAIEHMHSRGVIHRDLKPENILLDHNMRIKVTDFGTAKVLSNSAEMRDGEDPPPKRSRSFVGTPEYVSPEILSEGKESSRSSDYWGFGCILYQIIAGRPPFQAKTDYLMFQKIINLEYEFPLGFPAGARHLVEKLLVVDPTQRLGGGADGIEAIKSHPFFTSDPAIDFSTIWTVEPPPIETGLVEPKPQSRGQFVLLDDFGPNADSSEHEMEDDDENEDATTGSNASAGGAAATTDTSTTTPEKISTSSDRPRTKWTGVLNDNETITLASPVLVKRGLIKKKRTLILTDSSRLICIKETPEKVTIKNEVLLGSALRGGVTKPGAVGFIKADVEGDKALVLRTSSQTLKFEDPSGGATRWLSELNETHERGLRGA